MQLVIYNSKREVPSTEAIAYLIRTCKREFLKNQLLISTTVEKKQVVLDSSLLEKATSLPVLS